MPEPGSTFEDVSPDLLAGIATQHKQAAEAIAHATGLGAQLISYALMRAIQIAAVVGVSHSETSARHVINVTTKIALRLKNESNELRN